MQAIFNLKTKEFGRILGAGFVHFRHPIILNWINKIKKKVC